MNLGGTVRTVGVTLVVAVIAAVAASPGVSCSASDDREPASSATGKPPPAKTRVIALPAPRADGPMSLEATIRARRSVREFTDGYLSLDEVGQLLWAAQGITSPNGARAAPSAGGTYPLEIYLAPGRVTELEPGIYRYRPAGHELELVAAGDVRARLAEAALDQAWVADGAIDVVIAAVHARTTQRYGERGIRYVHLEAGHATENLCLQATALGLGAVTVGAFSDDELAAAMHMPEDHEPLYVIPVGRPASPGVD
jgi:SagB-type dehydrogenase family enzyme